MGPYRSIAACGSATILQMEERWVWAPTPEARAQAEAFPGVPGQASASGGSARSGALEAPAAPSGASGCGSSGGGSAGRLRGRPPALLEGPPPSTLLFFAFGIVTPLDLGMMPFKRFPVHLPDEGDRCGAGLVTEGLKQLAEPLGQLLSAAGPQQRCMERRSRYRRGGSAHLSDSFWLS
jgi:hypothetical protein